jgi:DNA (cytosine-5)-methyltransferase 1
MLTLGSLFAGIGGFDAGFHRAGFETRWFVEWDKDCQRVLSHHFPGVPIHGDISAVDPADLAPVDVITFGSPCQDLSVAGKRAGLDGARSGLFYEALRIIGAVRPAIAVWENVPGAFSSNRGRDFGAVLDALAELGALDIGWRVLDAQWFGVAQRRRRLFVVADLRGRRASEILAFADSLSGHPAPRRTAGQGTTHDLAPSLTGSGRGVERAGESRGQDPVIAYVPMLTDAPATATGRHTQQQGIEHHIVAHTLSANGADASEDGTGRGTPLVTAWVGSYAGGGGAASEVAPTLQASGGEDDRGVRNPLIAFTNRGNDTGGGAERLRAASHGAIPMVAATLVSNGDAQNGHRDEHGLIAMMDVHPTLAANRGRPGSQDWQQHAAVATNTSGYQGDRAVNDDGIWPTLPAQGANNGGGAGALLQHATTVRRLTPTECERLQSFPDDWTAVDGMSDSARYRMLGNAVCVNVAEWLARQIVAATQPDERNAS